MFEGPETFVIENDCIKRCNIHCENKFVLVKEIKVTKNVKMLKFLKFLKFLEQKFIFQIGTLNPHGIDELFSFD